MSRVSVPCWFHAKDEAARQWYESWKFEPSPTDPFHFFLMLNDLKALLGK